MFSVVFSLKYTNYCVKVFCLAGLPFSLTIRWKEQAFVIGGFYLFPWAFQGGQLLQLQDWDIKETPENLRAENDGIFCSSSAAGRGSAFLFPYYLPLIMFKWLSVFSNRY